MYAKAATVILGIDMRSNPTSPTSRDYRLELSEVTDYRPHVVIVGADFGSLSAACGLADKGNDLTLIDMQNDRLFKPLLCQVAIADLANRT